MPSDRKNLNLFQPVLFLGVILTLGAGLSFVFQGTSDSRAERIYREYSTELNDYIANNQEGLEYIFSEVLPDSFCDEYNDDHDACRKAREEAINDSISDSLEHYSSTFFVVKGNSQPMLWFLSGSVSNAIPFNHSTAVNQLLNGEVDSIPPDDYRFNHPYTKEVIVPFKDSNGKILGGIVRTVIE